MENAPEVFFTNGDDERLQRAWAHENGLREDTPLADILLAQIEANRTEVFYNLDPIRFDSAFLKRLPGHVKRTIAWRAAPGNPTCPAMISLYRTSRPSVLGMKAWEFVLPSSSRLTILNWMLTLAVATVT
ncbi:hypothetical protein [Mesorhizobium sp.]|uniref:hypothetical protein n=1 Tax=Mesorhizobium sp. TaxID=1871066 RepID=UPI000FE455D2|nr:hypothetical protein [Mesorhizobium sp.]RWK45654.1 MAG: hypothetical protein EOR47_29975 [Mesorhizobium sp.]RWK92301.1 MAG: hypothetical protein EOR53_26655 [Mesorhizobium sp.]TIP81771.1 MAG: hypothetical protein E5X60_34430 [Mesorhizobium sp.]TIQ24799.1 MAG: hypothetical protein E5X54_33075 [Mesorhizobium sp.]TJW48620.1 MAG: hypothetical protein E5X59_10885 [Mesorhizobium sp.]